MTEESGIFWDKQMKNIIEGGKLSIEIPNPVHVAIICPPGAAITALLNKMGKKGATFVLTQSIPMQVSTITKLSGESNIQIFPLLIFSISRSGFESWMKCRYEETAVYNMDDIMNDKITVPERN